MAFTQTIGQRLAAQNSFRPSRTIFPQQIDQRRAAIQQSQLGAMNAGQRKNAQSANLGTLQAPSLVMPTPQLYAQQQLTSPATMLTASQDNALSQQNSAQQAANMNAIKAQQTAQAMPANRPTMLRPLG